MPADFPFRTVGVVGLGVMGGSLCRALRSLDSSLEVTGWSRDPGDVDAAAEAGVLSTAGASMEATVAERDLVVLAVPVEATRSLLSEMTGLTLPGTVIHDVASLKAPVHMAALDAGLGSRWVGGHPMAGSEGAGFAASREDLYRGARVWLTAEDDALPALNGVTAMWQALGAHPQLTDAEAHDARMALASHLPQLTSNALARVMAASGLGVDELGPGGRDTTRLAASSTGMWMDILAHAPKALPEALRALGREATALADAVEQGDLDALRAVMDETREWRDPS